MKTASAQQRLFPGITALPFVIPTGAKRSGGTCGFPRISLVFREMRDSTTAGSKLSTGHLLLVRFGCVLLFGVFYF